ncbi:xylulokinase [Staphylococcus sp. NRL 16/872]|uniref:xylulokinase n=1 Tax=Staphylococcus sp. NRL 16/872 TaxID=2930131 RepID=UPI001FB51C13|nr:MULTISPECIES: xylulokinase [unclassified Staphylococcus]MCJ1655562.1 xylulokinase [Staphylococcus sp. NRL 21/187]MCJ1667286.1 xylulokinase [Staphylococcus sp. NRL 19/737]WEN69772.1 xylulokinase [Staphylococcus sp. NRL 16/872]
MKEVVLGIDLGTSAVKIIAVTQQGEVVASTSEPLTLIQTRPGYSEQDPAEWFEAIKQGIKHLNQELKASDYVVKGISFSGQMHGLVALDASHAPVRNAILWNDTRNSEQCHQIKDVYGERLNGNPILEGFTLPKMLWVKQHEPEIWNQVDVFVLPKDYVRYCLTGQVHMEYSDAASTLLLSPQTHDWTRDVGECFGIGDIYPPLVRSTAFVGEVVPELAQEFGFTEPVKVFAGGGDNACGAIGAGIINDNDTLCSIGTSGVVLNVEKDSYTDYHNNIHFFDHSVPQTFYAMGVTLAAGYSLSWLKKTFFEDVSFDDIVKQASTSSVGANHLLFAPYLAGERTPHGDAFIRGSFIGISGSHTKVDFARAVLEGITYSLYDSIQLIREAGKEITHVTSIGGGAKSAFWLQMQADIFNATIRKLKHEEGPSMGAAMIAAYGLEWFNSFDECVEQFIDIERTFEPNLERHRQYEAYYHIYQRIYKQTHHLTEALLKVED